MGSRGWGVPVRERWGGEGVAGEGLGRRATWWPCGAGLSGGACCGWSHRSFSPAPALHTHLGFLHRRGTRRGQESGQGCPRPSPSPQPGPGNVTCPALPAPGRRVPRAQRVVAQAAPAPRAVPGAQRGAPTAERSPGAEVRHPRGDAGPGGGGRRAARKARAPVHCRRPPARPPARNPAPSVPRPSASAAPSAGPGSVTRAASAINNPQPAPGDPPVTPDPRGGAAGETMTRCTRQPSS